MVGCNRELRVLNSARKSMPTLDYVSIIRSVYGDRRAMLAAACGTALTAGLSAFCSKLNRLRLAVPGEGSR